MIKIKTKLLFRVNVLGCLLFVLMLNPWINSHAIPMTYGVTVSTEGEELNRLLNQLTSILEDEDAIIIQIDESKTNDRVSKVIEKFQNIIPKNKLHVFYASLNRDFGGFKNKLLDTARQLGSTYFFQLDADEYLSDPLIKNLKWYISKNEDVDLFWVPRANYYVDIEGFPDEFKHKDKFIYPGPQARIMNLVNPDIKYFRKIHESITGFKKEVFLPHEIESNCWDIIHIKTAKDQFSRVDFYRSLENEDEYKH